MAYSPTTWEDGITPLSPTNLNHMETGIKDAHDLIAAIADKIYPVGSYYETSDADFNPNDHTNTIFRGTWILETPGQVHVSAGSGYAVSGALNNTSDGGSKDAIVPYHDHGIPALTGTAATAGQHAHSYIYTNRATFKEDGNATQHWSAPSEAWASTTESGAHAHSVTVNAGGTAKTGKAGSENNTVDANMMPHINVYRWHRTA